MAYIPLGALMGALTYSVRHSEDAPKRKEGHWIEINRYPWPSWYECSECHNRYVTEPVYCPNCKSFMHG